LFDMWHTRQPQLHTPSSEPRRLDPELLKRRNNFMFDEVKAPAQVHRELWSWFD